MKKNQLFNFLIKSMPFLFKRKKTFVISILIIFSQNIYSSKGKNSPSNNKCPAVFASSHRDTKTVRQRLQTERERILNKAVRYRGPYGYETYIHEYPGSLLGDSFQNILSVFSKEELEFLEWNYIEFDDMKFAKVIQVTDKKILVSYIDGERMKTRKLNKKQLRTVRPSPIAQGRVKFREALKKMKFVGDERYISIPSRYLSDQYGRVLEVYQGAVLVEIIGYNGKLREIQLPPQHLFKAEVDPVSKDWFNRIEQAIKKLESLYTAEENEEESLTNQGHKQILIKGINEVNRLIKLVKHLRQFNINPFGTHIEDLASQIESHIERVRQGIESQNIEVTERLSLLEQFEIEAYQKVKKEAVTYMWWIYWNKRLSILATPSQKREEKGDWWKSEENAEYFLDNINEQKLTEFNKDEYTLMKIIQQFPDQVILPTASDLGTMAFNRADINSIAPVHLAGTEQWMDGALKTPEEAFSHDISHAFLQFSKEESSSSIPMRQLYQQIEEESDLTIYDREVIENIYFLIEHEREWADISHPKTVIRMMTSQNIEERFQNANDLGSWIETDMEANSLRSHLRKMAKTFNRAIATIVENMKQHH